MKTWHKIALIVMNLAVLPWTWRIVSYESTYWPRFMRLFLALPMLHILGTAIVVYGCMALSRRVRTGVTPPGSQRP
jgi:hypothetical protein